MIENISEISKQSITNAERSFLDIEKSDIGKNTEEPFLNNDIEVSKSNLNPENLNTRNEMLERQNHPNTDIPFNKDVVEIEGKHIEGVFPEFPAVTEVKLLKDMFKLTDASQFRECNRQLAEQIKSNPELARKFNKEQLEQINEFNNPDGYTWHHHQQPGWMQLVDTKLHSLTGHTGGRAIWGINS